MKDRRETYFGHKVVLTGGAAGLITDLVVEKGKDWWIGRDHGAPNRGDDSFGFCVLEREKARSLEVHGTDVWVADLLIETPDGDRI